MIFRNFTCVVTYQCSFIRLFLSFVFMEIIDLIRSSASLWLDRCHKFTHKPLAISDGFMAYPRVFGWGGGLDFRELILILCGPFGPFFYFKHDIFLCNFFSQICIEFHVYLLSLLKRASGIKYTISINGMDPFWSRYYSFSAWCF